MVALVVAVALPVLARSAGLPCPLAAPPSRGSQSRVLKVAYANNAVFNTNNVILISANAAPASSSSLGFRSLESTSANQPTLRGFRERIPELVPVLQSSRLFGLGSVALKLTTIPKTRTNKAFNLKIHIGSQLFTLSARVYAHHGLSNRPWVDVPTFTCSVTGATDGDGLGLGAVVLTGHHGKAFQMIRLSHSAAFGKSTSIDLKAFERIHHQLGDNYDTHILSLSGQYTLHFFGPSGDTPVRLIECTKEGSFGVSFDTFDGASIVSSSFLKPATTASISAVTGDSSCAPMKRSRQRGSSVLNAAGASFRPARASVPSRSKAATITLSVKQEPIVKQEPESPPSMPSMEMESLLSNHVELTSLDLKSFDMSNAGNSFDWSQGMNSSMDAGILDTVQELPSFEMAPMLSPLSSYQPFPLPTFTFSSVDDVHMADDVFPECKTELPEMSLSNWDPLPSFSPPAAKPLTFDVFSSDLSRGVSDFNLI